MKKINVKPVEILKIELDDKVYDCKFTAQAILILHEEFKGMETFKQMEKKPFEAGSQLLYCGMKVCDDTVTYDIAKAIISNMTIDNIMDLFEFASETIDVEGIHGKKQKVVPADHQKKKKKRKK